MPILVVKNSIAKNVFYSLLALIFVACGIIILFVGENFISTLMGWICITFFGLGTLVFLKRLFDNRPRIVIDQYGIFDRTLGIGIIEWQDIERVYTNSIMGSDFISLVLYDNDKYLKRTNKPLAKLAKYNKTLGFETINLNLSGINTSSKEVFDSLVKQLTKIKIKNLNNLAPQSELIKPNFKNFLSGHSKNSQN